MAVIQVRGQGLMGGAYMKKHKWGTSQFFQGMFEPHLLPVSFNCLCYSCLGTCHSSHWTVSFLKAGTFFMSWHTQSLKHTGEMVQTGPVETSEPGLCLLQALPDALWAEWISIILVPRIQP